MTVTIPSQDLTAEDKRKHVIAYLSRAHGTKGAYLPEHGINPRAIRRWRRAMAVGNLEQGLIPRQTGNMTTEDIREIVALREQVEQLKNQLHDAQDHLSCVNQELRDKEQSSATDVDRIRGDYERRLAKSQKQQEELRQAIEALGKAIALMHKDGTS